MNIEMTLSAEGSHNVTRFWPVMCGKGCGAGGVGQKSSSLPSPPCGGAECSVRVGGVVLPTELGGEVGAMRLPDSK